MTMDKKQNMQNAVSLNLLKDLRREIEAQKEIFLLQQKEGD
jgi:hypothetical protein